MDKKNPVISKSEMDTLLKPIHKRPNVARKPKRKYNNHTQPLELNQQNGSDDLPELNREDTLLMGF